MESSVLTVEDYLNKIPEERKSVFCKLRQTIFESIPKGFVEQINYGMIGYIVPKSTYPSGYHCNPKLPLPFLNIACQKNFIALYHMGIYFNPKLMDWFIKEFPKHSNQKLDIGKSCIRFKKIDQIPYDLIAELVSKISVVEWIDCYENQIKNQN